MKTYKKKYYQKKRTFRKRGGAGAAAERFKCPFCDKTYSAMSNIYLHCDRKHPGQPMPRLTHASTAVRGAAAADPRSARRSHAASHAADRGGESFKCPFCDKTYTAITNIYGHCRRKHPGIPMVRLTYDNTIVRPDPAASHASHAPAAIAPAAIDPAAVERRQNAASRLARRIMDSDDSDDDDLHPALAGAVAADRRERQRQQFADLAHASRPAAAAIAPPVGAADRERQQFDDLVAHLAADRRAASVSDRAAQIYRDLALRQQRHELQNLSASRGRAAAPASPAAAAAVVPASLASHASHASRPLVAVAAAAAAPPPPPPPAAAAAAAAAAAPVRVGAIVARTGTLQGNRDYITNPVMIPNFPTSGNKLHRSSTYMDYIDMEDKNVLDALNGDPDTLAFKISDSFCVITKDELFTLMNNPDSIKYECNRICEYSTDGLGGISQSAVKGVPYLSLGSFSQFQGLVSFSHLWHIVVSQQPQQSQAYELVDAHRPHMLSMASHNFLFGPGSAGARAVSAAHCQAGQDASTVYEIRILPLHTHSRSRAATTIQRIVRGHRSRKNPINR